MAKTTTNYYIDEFGKKHALAPNFVISDYYPDKEINPISKPKPTSKPKPKPKPKPKQEKPVPNYKEMFDAYSNSVEIRKKEANVKKEEQERLLMQAYDATKARRKQMFDASVNEQNMISNESLRKAYIASELSKRDLMQQQSAMGISGGAGLSGEMALKNKYLKKRQEEEARRSINIGNITSEYNSSEQREKEGFENDRKKLIGEYEKTIKSMQAELDKQYAAILKLMR